MKTKLSVAGVLFLTLCPPVRAQTNCAQPPAGLLGWWPAEANASDRIGSLPGTLQGSASATNAGFIGRAFTLDGTNAAVDLGNWFNLQSFTLSLWIKAGVTQQTDADVLDNNHTDSRSWAIQYANTNNTHSWGAAGIGAISFELTPGTWQHLAVTVDTNHVASLYLDGNLAGFVNGSGPIAYDGTEFLRLGRWGGGGRFWSGQLDELMLWNRALSAGEVAAIRAAGTNGICNQVPPGFFTQPSNLTVPLGQGAIFATIAAGTQPLQYQWRLWGTNLPAATNATLTLTNVQLSQAGDYQVVVTNAFGAVSSAVAHLGVLVWTNGVFWTGGGDGSSWSDGNNWSGNSVPGTNDDVLIALSAPVVVVYQGAQPTMRSLLNYGTLSIQGSAAGGQAVLTASGDVTNRGTILLDSSVWNCSATLTVGGTLVNAPEGLLQVNLGAGNSRLLNANVLNQGTVNVAGGIGLYCNGAGKLFRQEAGSINGLGTFTWANGEFDFVGGALSGGVYVRDGTVDVAASAGASTIYAAGNSTLVANRSTQATVWVQGNSSYGQATLTTAQGAVNAGTIHLESSVWNCVSVLVVGGSNLVNAATGVIVAINGQGSTRSISGYLINQGVVDGGDYYVDIFGTYEAAGGRIVGPGRLRSANVRVSASPAQATTIDLWGSCTLLTDNLSNTVLYVHGGGDGQAVLTASGDVTNRGTIVLDSSASNCGATLTVGGTLVNAPEGVLQVNLGAGNNRLLNANVLNQGTVNVAGGIGLYCNGAGKLFRQEAGSINGLGTFTWADGEFDFIGGALSGGVYVRDGTVDVAASAGASTIYAAGNSTLVANRSTQATVWVQGNSSYGQATLTTVQGAVNAGTIHLELSVWTCVSVLVVGGSNLVNAATGVIVAMNGQGSTRSISGYLINQGVVDGGDYYVDIFGTYEAAGGRIAGPGRLRSANVRVSASPAQATTIDLWGSCTLLTDNLSNTVLYVHGGGDGQAVLTASGDVTNRGTLVLDSSAWNCGATLTVGGTLVNAPEGVLQVNLGAGNNRLLNANVLNQGTVNVAGGIGLYCNGAGKLFRQEAGSINGLGLFTWADGEFDFVGGALSGGVYVRDGAVDVAASAGASTIYAAGNTTLVANRSTQATVRVQGNSSYGQATLTTAQGAVNAGTIHLESSVWNCVSVLVVGGSNLLNAATGVIVAMNGQGSTRSISGYLINQGVVDGGDYYVDIFGTYEAAGGRIVGPGRLRSANVRVTGSPAQATTIDLWGSCTLLTDNLSNTVLYVHGGGDGQAVLTASGDVTNRGTILLDSSAWNCGATLMVGGTLVNAPEGVIQVNPGAGNSRGLNAELLNAGTVTFNYGGSLGRAGANHRNTGLLRLAGVTATISGASFLNQNPGEISGTGTFSCSGVNFQNRGIVSPGASGGLLTFVGAYNQAADGRLNIEIGGLTAGSQYDQLAVNGDATLDGLLSITVINDFLPAVGNSFTVLTCNSLSGQFSNYAGLVYYTNAALSPTYLANALQLTALGVTNPVVEAPSIVVQPQSISVIQGQTATFRVTANGTQPFACQWLFNNAVLAGATNASLVLNHVQTNQAGLYALRLTNAAGAALSASATLVVRQVTDLIVTDVNATNDAVAGQPLLVSWLSVNAGSASAIGPWVETVGLSTNDSGANAFQLAAFNFTNNLLPGQSIGRTQAVILPGGLEGKYFVVVTIDASNVVPEDVFETNNTTVSSQFVTIRAPDLVVTSETLPAAAQFGQSIQVVWSVKNGGSAAASGPWNDRLLLSTGSNNLSGALALLTVPAPSGLQPGGSYTNLQLVSLPLSSSLNPGTYYLVVQADADGSVAESNEANNLASQALALTLPPLPDLAVGQVTSPTNAVPGQTIPVSWAVTNLGAAPAPGPWSQVVYLVPAGLSLDQFAANPMAYPQLGSVAFTNSLAVGDGLVQTQQVTIPLTGLAGDLRVAVCVDGENTLFEQTKTNNAALAPSDLEVPASLSLILPTASVAESTPNPNLACLVSRNGDLSAPASVTLASSATNRIAVPSTVTIPAGAAAAPFTAVVLDDGLPGPDLSVALSAQADGYLGVTSAVLVVNTQVPRLSISLATAQTLQGQSVLATVGSDPPSGQPVVVSIASSDPARLSVPSSVTIPTNWSSSSFSLLAVDSTLIEPPGVFTVTATAPGFVGASTNLTVISSHLPTLTLSLDRTNISEGDGPLAVVGTVNRLPFASQPLTVALFSANPAAALVPAQVTIPPMEGAATFYIAAVDDNVVTGPKVTVISAQALDASGNPVGAPATETLVVQDNDGPTLQVQVAQKVVGKGLNPATSAVVGRNTPATNDLVVTLKTSATNETAMPPTVLIPIGQSNAAFSIASLNDGLTHTSVVVLITASATNYTSGSDQLTVSDLSLPDLVITSVTVPPSGFVGEPITVSFRLANQGLGPVTNGISQAVYLITDSAPGSAVLVGTVPFGGPLSPGQYVDQSLMVPGSALASPGSYRIQVLADAGGATTEINKANNTGVSANSIVVSSGYTAVVKAGVTSVVAGTPVPLGGSATLIAGGPAANQPVNILLSVRGFQRVLSVVTDANGNFAAVFNPLPTEAGLYTVAAVVPGITQAPAQDQFRILGMALQPASLPLNVIAGNSAAGSASLQNLGDLPLTGLSATVNGLAANLTAAVSLSTNTCLAQAPVTLNCSVTAADPAIRQSTFTVHVASAEGVTLDLPVSVTVVPLTAQLAATPAQLTVAMLRGGQTIAQFDVVNLGGVASGPITVCIPSLPWLSVACPNPLPSLDPGASNRVTLLLMPAAGLPLGPYTGSLALNTPGSSASVGFQFLNVSDLKGCLRLTAVDQGHLLRPGGAQCHQRHGPSDRRRNRCGGGHDQHRHDGHNSHHQPGRGLLRIEVSADDHGGYKDMIFVQAAQTNEVVAFMPRQTVKYYWTVEPTQITDRAKLTVTTVFETAVPAPVVTVEPNLIDLAFVGTSTQINLKISNHGLIAAKKAFLYFQTNSVWQFTPLTSDLGDLPGLSVCTVPLSITRVAGKAKDAGGGECSASGVLRYGCDCGGKLNLYDVPIAIVNMASDCGGAVVLAFAGAVSSAAGAVGQAAYAVQSAVSGAEVPCAECQWEYLKWVGGCVLEVLPLGHGLPACLQAGYAGYEMYFGNPDNALLASLSAKLGIDLLECLESGIEGLSGAGQAIGMFNCAYEFLELNEKCGAGAGGSGGSEPQGLSSPARGRTPKDSVEDLAPLTLQLDRLGAVLGPLTNLFGDPVWFTCQDQVCLSNWLTAFQLYAQTNSDAGYRISPTEQAQLLALPICPPLTTNDISRFLARWNRTIDYAGQNILFTYQVPQGWDSNFLALDVCSNLLIQANDALTALAAEGYSDPVVAVQQTAGDLLAMISRGSGGICARVRLQLDQEAILTRDAFKATLEIANSTGSQLAEVSIQLLVSDGSGRNTTSLFGILPPELTGLTGVDGTGVIAAQSTGKAIWTLIPTSDAAPTHPTEHFVSGTLQYRQEGTLITVPLAPMSISVLPSPSLTVRYFHQRDVFADDPFTPQIEPSVPYSLAVMVQNRGYGTAHNLQIASAQPKIIENEKGLVIDFKIIGAQVGTQAVTPSLTVNLGDLGPGQIKIGRWLLTSSLQGLFTDYKATFAQVSDLGDQRLSLFDSVEIHELNHLVQAQGAWDDGLPDFLVNDVADVNSLPDTLYLSDGTVQPVSVVQTASTDGPANATHLQVQLTATFPSGFNYVRVPDPANGQFQLQGVIRLNGSNFRAENFWTTDRTFIGLGQRPIYENILHLFDYHTNAGPDTYLLVYAAASSASQTNPPSSAVLALPPRSPSSFGVAWSGQNNSGQASVAYYDIFVSDNAGPFTIWLPRTVATSALYRGSFGHTYAFYSVATDTAGNVEAPPTTPEAVTTVSLSNAPPTISFGGPVTANEGDTVRITPTAADPDVPSQTLTFRLLGSAPPGVVVDPVTGQLRWSTGPGSGPSTNFLAVVVTDNGFPPLSATGYVTIVVNQRVWPPLLAPISDYTIDEGYLLAITNTVTDYNLPARAYTFSLGSNTPAGASINPANGVFTWTPTSTQGPSTNPITVIVTDTGLPALSATQQFTVVVRDVLPDIVLSLGGTNLMAGESAVVPVNLASTLDLASLSFQLGPEPPQLTNFVLQPAAAEVTSATLQPLGPDTYAVSFTLNPALRIDAARTLARLTFLAASNPHSAIVPLAVSPPRAYRSSGLVVTNTTGFGGRVIVVGAEPVLDLGNGPVLTLYGHPGASYVLQDRTNLTSAPWGEFNRLTLAGRWVQLTNLPAPGPRAFYRAYEAPGSGLDLQSLGGDRYLLTLRGQIGTRYTVQSATNLAVPGVLVRPVVQCHAHEHNARSQLD